MKPGAADGGGGESKRRAPAYETGQSLMQLMASAKENGAGEG